MSDKPEPLFRVGEAEVYRAADYHKVVEHQGRAYVPMLFEGDAVGAIPAGRMVEKVNCEDGDSYPNGTRGRVLASRRYEDMFVYYVSWYPSDGLPCLVMGRRIKEVL